MLARSPRFPLWSLLTTMVAVVVGARPQDAAINVERATPNKLVVAHHIVGYTYPYAVSNWEKDIQLAHSSGLDGFALNVGSDSWESQQVANAYVSRVGAEHYPSVRDR